jgi:hypothetical protein
VPVLVHPQHIHLQRIEQAVRDANVLQGFARFEVRETLSLPNRAESSGVVSARAMLARLPRLAKRRAIAVLQNRISDDYFSWESREGLVVTTADWETLFAPPPLPTYLLYQFACTIVSFSADLPENIPPPHGPPVGCFYDLCNEKKDIRLGMVSASLCAICEGILAGMSVEDDALRALDAVLGFVRSASIRRARQAPECIFIAHGHSTVWHDLQKFLVDDLHLVVEEFNQRATAGRTTQTRLQEMLDRSRFAFIVMTGEDVQTDNEVRARQNVIHELGLCQGRFGFENAIMLVEGNVAEPSNQYGVSSIRFPRGRFNQARKEIRNVLRRAGIIP